MGDPKKQRPKYHGPEHPWRRERLSEERVLVEEYGLKNKRDFWKVTSKLGLFKRQAKLLIVRKGAQAEIERKLFLEKLQRLKLIGDGAAEDDVLKLTVRDLLERRLQTLVFRKGFAHSISQARQFVVHGHITVNGQKMNIPSFLVPIALEETVAFASRSSLSDPEHPERQVKEQSVEVAEVVEEEEKVESPVAEESKPGEEVDV